MDGKLNHEYLEFLLAEIVKNDHESTMDHFYNQFKNFQEKEAFLCFMDKNLPKKHEHLLAYISEKLGQKEITEQKAASFLEMFHNEQAKIKPEIRNIQYDAMIHRLLQDIEDISQKSDVLSLVQARLTDTSDCTVMNELVFEHIIALEMTIQLMMVTGFHQKKIGGVIQMIFDSHSKLKLNRKIFVLNKCIFYLSGLSESTLTQFVLSTIHSFKLALSDSTPSPGRVPETFAQKWKEVTSQLISIFDQGKV